MIWIYKCNEVIEIPSDNPTGFVYLITNIQSGRKYIGKKLFYFAHTKIKTVTLKSGVKKKKKIRRQKESDWRTYFGSCRELLEDLAVLGEDMFSREILFLCYTKSELSYIEARTQFEMKVLENDDFYNGIIGCKISGRCINGKINVDNLAQ